MTIAMSVLFGDHSYYYAFSEKQQIVVSGQADAELTVPNIGCALIIEWINNHALISIPDGRKKRTIEAPINEPTVIDNNNQLAVYFTVADPEQTTVPLPRDCCVDIERISAAERNTTHYNRIDLNLPFIPRSFIRIVREDGKTTVYDRESRNGVYLNGKKLPKGGKAVLKEGDILSLLTTRIIASGNNLLFENVDGKLTVHRIKPLDVRRAASISPIDENTFAVNGERTRRLFPVDPETIIIDLYVENGTGTKINWLNVLVTPIVTISLLLVLVFVMGMSPVMLIMSGVMSVVSAILTVINYRKEKKKQLKDGKKNEEDFSKELVECAAKVQIGHDKELNELKKNNPAPAECISAVQNRNDILWTRQEDEGDFLQARLGLGTIPAKVTAKWGYNKRASEETDSERKARQLAEGSVALQDAPVLYDFLHNKITGIEGNHDEAMQLIRNIITELTTTHSYTKLKIVALLSEKEAEQCAWMRWLPHCQDEDHQVRYLFTSSEAAKNTMDEIEAILQARNNHLQGYRATNASLETPFFLFIITDASILNNHPIQNSLLSNDNLSCSSIFLNRIPAVCEWYIDVNEGCGNYYNRSDARKKQAFRVDEYPWEQADQFARAIAPLYVEAANGLAPLPSKVSFLEGYGVKTPEQLNIEDRWKQAETYKTLSVPIAKKKGNENFLFDVHNMKHGAHGGVAGTNRSGKTEMVVSWLLSLAVNFSPQDVQFILIDFLGTGLLEQLEDLPHLAGTISQRDTGRSIARRLISLKSEATRRAALIAEFSKYGIKNINDLNEKYNPNGPVNKKLPILLLVVDEYAQFRVRYPAFDAEIANLTMVGAALGIFVVLMSQSLMSGLPLGTAANLKFRWCLRVVPNSGESQLMLQTKDAEEIKISTPGRAYIKIATWIYEEVQSFWSGAPYNPNKMNNEATRLPISQVTLDGQRVPCEDISKNERTQQTEADVIIRYIMRYCKEHSIPSTDKIWTNDLPERLALPDVLPVEFNNRAKWHSTNGNAFVIGMTDDPEKQTQYPLALDFAKFGHIAVYGDPSTGKTTLLQTLIMSIAMTRKPDEASIYIMDFGGGNMITFEDLPHVGGIVYPNQPGKLQKLMLLVNNMLLDRQNSFPKVGAKDITNYRHILSNTEERIPDVYILVDNLGAVVQADPNAQPFFQNLTQNGANYGIYLVATAPLGGIPFRIENNIKYQLALQLDPIFNYRNIVGKVDDQLPAIKGRGYTKGDPPLEFQTALPAPGKNDIEVSDNIRKIIAAMKRAWSGDLPDIIPEMPEMIPYGSINTNGVALGLSGERIQPVVYDYTTQHYLLISGTRQSGKTNLLQVISKQLKEKLQGNLIIFDVMGKRKNTRWKFADTYLTKAADIDAFVQGLRPELQRRDAIVKAGKKEPFEPIIFAIDDYEKFYTPISTDTVSRLWAIASLGKDLSVYLIASGDSQALLTHYNQGDPIVATMCQGKQFVMLGGSMLSHPAIITNASFAQQGIQLENYYGYFVDSRTPEAFKTIYFGGDNAE